MITSQYMSQWRVSSMKLTLLMRPCVLCLQSTIVYVSDIEYAKTCSTTLLVLKKTVFRINSGPELRKSVFETVSDILRA